MLSKIVITRGFSSIRRHHNSVYCLNTWYMHPLINFFSHHQELTLIFWWRSISDTWERISVREIIFFYLLDDLDLLYRQQSVLCVLCVLCIFTELRNVPNVAATIATAVSVRIITNNSIPTTMAINITPKPNSIKYDQSPLMSTCRPIDLSSLTRVIMLVNRSASFGHDGKHTNAIYFILIINFFLNLMYCRIEEEGIPDQNTQWRYWRAL